MPQNRTTSKTLHPPPSEASKEKVAAIVDEITEEERESLIRDFEIQGEAMIKQAVKRFEAEAKQILSVLPDKASLPKELVKMPMEEFIRRGGTIPAVMESLKKEKLQAAETLLESDMATEAAGSNVVTGDEVGIDRVCPPEPVNEYVTPAMSTRSHAVTGMDTGNVTKRKPKPLEHVRVNAWSQVSGSPVDEQTFLQLKMAEYADTLKEQLLQDTASMPQKWRSHFIKSIQKMKSQAISRETEFVTPMIHRTKEK